MTTEKSDEELMTLAFGYFLLQSVRTSYVREVSSNAVEVT